MATNASRTEDFEVGSPTATSSAPCRSKSDVTPTTTATPAIKKSVSFGVFTVVHDGAADGRKMDNASSHLEISTAAGMSTLDCNELEHEASNSSSPSLDVVPQVPGQISASSPRQQMICEVSAQAQQPRSPWEKFVVGLRRRARLRSEEDTSAITAANSPASTAGTTAQEHDMPDSTPLVRSPDKEITTTPNLDEIHQGQQGTDNNHNDDRRKEEEVGVPPNQNAIKQFRIRSRHSYGSDLSISPSWWKQRRNSYISNYLSWAYRASFFSVLMSSYAVYMAITVVFALCIFAVGTHQSNCVSSVRYHFMDAYQLSWSTLSTVGYGVVAPTSANSDDRCIGVNSFLALESFVGVLFSGVVAAVMIGKVARIQSIAQVCFSHPICVRFGIAAMDPDDREDDTLGNGPQQRFPCPILEFRIVNKLYRERGGEILNATVSVVASVLDADDESDRFLDSLRLRDANVPWPSTTTTTEAARMVGTASTRALTAGTNVARTTGAALFGVGRFATQATGTLVQQLNRQLTWNPRTLLHVNNSDEPCVIGTGDLPEEAVVGVAQQQQALEDRWLAQLERERSRINGFIAMTPKRTYVSVDEGSTNLAPPRTYHKLEVETDTHPHFKRVWNVRHILNECSPLLTAQARRLIEENQGYWPVDLCSASAIRQNLHFNDCIVSFSGISNASGSAVHSQKVYEFDSLHIGYTFANVLSVENGRVLVDIALVNDVHEQTGGGAEPIKVD